MQKNDLLQNTPHFGYPWVSPTLSHLSWGIRWQIKKSAQLEQAVYIKKRNMDQPKVVFRLLTMAMTCSPLCIEHYFRQLNSFSHYRHVLPVEHTFVFSSFLTLHFYYFFDIISFVYFCVCACVCVYVFVCPGVCLCNRMLFDIPASIATKLHTLTKYWPVKVLKPM